MPPMVASAARSREIEKLQRLKFRRPERQGHNRGERPRIEPLAAGKVGLTGGGGIIDGRQYVL
jgi:hypothetical protein